ncbi:uncharacterized protein LOC112501480 [Cynara cardunculus var. scolymus]|uniref:uncharacterized protein LOC112501480 n=1 Tax=Cynara cardunculus var. scolymus TaxID=59895 RepID=UPI000D62D71E|nr:uncharacterized protein LOC112501480 [Cynara cardunculus var. scolymus]
MHKAKGTTSKALRIQLQQEGTNNGVDHHEPSFRVLYYGDASAGSVPFMWESHPGTPKHALTESSLPPLTPPPSFQNHQLNKHSSKRSGFLRTVFLGSSRKTRAALAPSSFSSCSISSSSSSSSSSHLHSSQSTPKRKAEVRRRRSAVKFGLEEDYGEHGGGDGSPTSTLCFGGGLRKGYRVKKVKTAILSFVRHGKA